MDVCPQVSVVVASYNYEDFVVETLRSLWAQTCRDFEIVVVDDGSTDRSLANIRAFAAEHADGDVPIRVLTHPDGANHGLPATVELGVRSARGRYVAFCESDDLWTPDHLAVVMDAVTSSRGEARVVVNDVEIFGDPDRVVRAARARADRLSKFRSAVNRIAPSDFRDCNWILSFSCVMVLRKLLLNCDFNPEVCSAALDWWLWRQVCYDNPVHYVGSALTRWRVHISYRVVDQANGAFLERQRRFVVAGSRLLRGRHPVTSRWRLFCGSMRQSVGWRKKVRGVVKLLLPYCVQRAYAFRTYGFYFPDCRTWPGVLGWLQKTVIAVLPFGLVCWCKNYDVSQGVSSGTPAGRRYAPEPSFRIPRKKIRQMELERLQGLDQFAETIVNHADARIAVVLHLYYDKSWTAIARYLENLAPYRHDLYITLTEGRISEKTRDKIRAFAPEAVLLTCANRGFDIWPFVDVLNRYDLTRYDIVFKLHSKGVGRPFLYIYNQVFKFADWFYNLYDGVVGGLTVHRAVKALLEENASLVAAENLLVRDPPHKRGLLRRFCQARGIPLVEDYRFVAGTCFAVRGDKLRPLRELSLSEADFAPTMRGDFSTAHAIERILCFPACDRMKGLEVTHAEYPLEVEECSGMNSLRLLDDSRFVLDDDFVYRVLEKRMVVKYDVARLKLGDIRRQRADGTICALVECEPYKCLKGDQEGYEAYCRANRELSGFEMTPDRFVRLQKSMVTFDPRHMPVVRGTDNVVVDGQHRCCILLDRHGPDYEIEVVRIW